MQRPVDQTRHWLGLIHLRGIRAKDLLTLCLTWPIARRTVSLRRNDAFHNCFRVFQTRNIRHLFRRLRDLIEGLGVNIQHFCWRRRARGHQPSCRIEQRIMRLIRLHLCFGQIRRHHIRPRVPIKPHGTEMKKRRFAVHPHPFCRLSSGCHSCKDIQAIGFKIL